MSPQPSRTHTRNEKRIARQKYATLVLDQHPSLVVVEDDAGISKAIGRLLRAAGFEPLLFSSAEDLLQTDAANSAACFVLDIHLPGLSGFELQRRLAASGRKPHVIFITAHDETSARDEAQRLGCIAYLRKPFDGNALLEAIRVALSYGP